MPSLSSDVERLLSEMSREERELLFRRLRDEFSLHPLERDWNTSAEDILEAIRRSSDLTQRGIRGILAEASFFARVVKELETTGWKDVTPTGDVPYDAELLDGAGRVRVQIKMQRRRDGEPMMGGQAPKKIGFSDDVFVVETQKTRGGRRAGKKTRPYRFDDFDILGVSLAPSTGDWSRFLYTVASWLIPDPDDESLILKYQPVPPQPNESWTDDLLACIGWLRSSRSGRIRTSP